MIGLNRPHPKFTRGFSKTLIVEVKGIPKFRRFKLILVEVGMKELIRKFLLQRGAIKIFDPSTYKPNPGEKAKFVSGG